MAPIQLLKQFEGSRIRSLWNEDEEEWYFSVVDVVAVLTESNNPRRYWSDLKRKLQAEGSQVYDKIVHLKMKASDGKLRMTDAATTSQILRIVQSTESQFPIGAIQIDLDAARGILVVGIIRHKSKIILAVFGGSAARGTPPASSRDTVPSRRIICLHIIIEFIFNFREIYRAVIHLNWSGAQAQFPRGGGLGALRGCGKFCSRSGFFHRGGAGNTGSGGRSCACGSGRYLRLGWVRD